MTRRYFLQLESGIVGWSENSSMACRCNIIHVINGKFVKSAQFKDLECWINFARVQFVQCTPALPCSLSIYRSSQLVPTCLWHMVLG